MEIRLQVATRRRQRQESPSKNQQALHETRSEIMNMIKQIIRENLKFEISTQELGFVTHKLGQVSNWNACPSRGLCKQLLTWVAVFYMAETLKFQLETSKVLSWHLRERERGSYWGEESPPQLHDYFVIKRKKETGVTRMKSIARKVFMLRGFPSWTTWSENEHKEKRTCQVILRKESSNAKLDYEAKPTVLVKFGVNRNGSCSLIEIPQLVCYSHSPSLSLSLSLSNLRTQTSSWSKSSNSSYSLLGELSVLLVITYRLCRSYSTPQWTGLNSNFSIRAYLCPETCS